MGNMFMVVVSEVFLKNLESNWVTMDGWVEIRLFGSPCVCALLWGVFGAAGAWPTVVWIMERAVTAGDGPKKGETLDSRVGGDVSWAGARGNPARG